MAIRRNLAVLAAAAALATAPAQAQGNGTNVELTAEMWALAGVCSQYANYSVRNEALATWLNSALNGSGNAEAVMNRKDAKVAQISAATARVQQASSARERTERSDELSSSLMTRCRRLTNDPVASRFFFTAMN